MNIFNVGWSAHPKILKQSNIIIFDRKSSNFIEKSSKNHRFSWKIIKNHWFSWKIIKNHWFSSKKYQKSLIFIKKIIGNHIWRDNFNLNTRVSNFSKRLSIFIEKTWKIMDFHEELWKIISDVKISIYIPACRFFVINFHRKIIKNHKFLSKNDGESRMEIAPWILES